ncbi:hypothetical protein QZH41_006283 [Actinostola sp. cb2023]|nr:hypothetical protein QZH41_006283 [Actinostola sp. cb2023]
MSKERKRKGNVMNANRTAKKWKESETRNESNRDVDIINVAQKMVDEHFADIPGVLAVYDDIIVAGMPALNDPLDFDLDESDVQEIDEICRSYFSQEENEEVNVVDLEEMQNNDPLALSTSESQAAPAAPEHAQAPTPSQDSVAFITKQRNEAGKAHLFLLNLNTPNIFSFRYQSYHFTDHVADESHSLLTICPRHRDEYTLVPEATISGEASKERLVLRTRLRRPDFGDSGTRAFAAEKSSERQQFFKSSGRSNRKGKKPDELVTIPIGIGSNTNGVMKPLRGKSLPLKAMEADGAKTLFQRSAALRGICYMPFIGDGDSKAYAVVCASQLYGPVVYIPKEECVANVTKRMDTGHWEITKANRDNKNNDKAMAKAGKTILKHYSSPVENPQHTDCPEGPSSWCSYQRDLANGTNLHKPIKDPLPEAVVKVMQPLFYRLCDKMFLVGCENCYTPNANESLHHFTTKAWQMATTLPMTQ